MLYRLLLENGGRRIKIKKNKFHYSFKVQKWTEEESTTNQVEDSVEIFNALGDESAIIDPIIYNNNRKNCTKHAINYLAEIQMLSNVVK